MSRFIVGNAHLQMLGGSETFTFAFVEELVRLGHEVDVICPGPIGSWFDHQFRVGLGVRIVLNTAEQYDAAFINHNTTAEMLFRLFPSFPPEKVVQTIHGQYSELEKPYYDTHRQIQYVTISDELRKKYPYAQTIMNGVNLERFKPGEKVPGSVLSLCQSESFNAMLSEICAELGLSFTSRNKFTNPVWEIETELATAEIAIGIGRSAIEAMACGCAVLIADHRPYQGALTDGWGWEDLADRNYSGRSAGIKADRDYICQCLENYLPLSAKERCEKATERRRIAEQYHDIRKQVQRYLEVVG